MSRYTDRQLAEMRAEVLQRVDLVELIRSELTMRKSGSEWQACCPFHDENTPSFAVSARKDFYHCFGCGAHGDAIAWVMQRTGVGYVQALEELSGVLPARVRRAPAAAAQPAPPDDDEALYVPLLPVPEEAPRLHAGVEIWVANPKRGRRWRMTPTRMDAYRNAQGQLLGYVARVEFGKAKVTPQLTWCVAPDGTCGWSATKWPKPRPLQGLDELAARPDAKVLLVSGEKCKSMAAQKLPGLVVVTWPGGDQSWPHVDWMPLRGRHVCLWNDADRPGLRAMLGWEEEGVRQGERVPVYRDGIAHALAEIRVGSMTYIDLAQDPHTGLAPGLPEGWDVADAIADGWSAQQLVAWMRAKARPLHVRPEDRRAA